MTEAPEAPKQVCPSCGHVQEQMASVGKGDPKPGDIGICLACKAVLIFNQDLTVRTITVKEYNSLHWSVKQVVRKLGQEVKEIRQ